MNDPRLIGFSVLLALLWSGAALAWLLRVAKDRARRVSTLVMIGFALALGPFAFSKNGGDSPLRSGPAAPSAPALSLLLAEVRTNAAFDLTMPAGAVVHEPWLRRGASDDWFWLHATNSLFHAGTNSFRSVRVASRGTLAFPDGSLLEPFHAVLGLLPEPNWTNGPSRFWQAPAAGGGRLFTWEGVALDRNPATPVSFQAELSPDGDLIGRYERPHPATNFTISAFGETAWSVHGGATNAATVCRVNGAPVAETALSEILRDATRFELVWRAAEGDPDADPDGDGLSTRDELCRHGTDPKHADTDGDGLSDAAEILLGSNPLNADEDGDGVPDGVSPAGWAAHALWPTNETGNIIVSLVEAIPTNMAATFQLGDLSIPLRDPDTWTFSLEPGVSYSYRLFVTDGATANLTITNDVPGPPMRGATSWGRPLWVEGTGSVFDGPSFGGEGEMAIPVADLFWSDPHNGSHDFENSVCLHDGDEAVFTPSLLPGIAGVWTLDGFTRRGISFVLSVPNDGDFHSGTAMLSPGILRFGEVSLSADAHRCDATPMNPWCSLCGCYAALDCALVPSKRLLTLKHDNEVYLDVVHTNSSWVGYEDVFVDVRSTDGDEWFPLGPATNLAPWTVRVAGTFELRARGLADGMPFTTPVAEIEVQFPSIYDIIADTNVQSRANQEWRATLDDHADDPLLRREHGYWILLNTMTDTYGTWTNCYGPWTAPETNAFIKLPPPDPDIPTNATPIESGVIYPVAWFHTHTPTTYSTNQPGPGRGVGPSRRDYRYSITHSMPGIAYDYEKDPASPTNLIPYGWPKDKPATMYPIARPARRLFP